MKGKTRVGVMAVLCLLLVSASACTLDRIAAQQVKATGLWDELTEGKEYGQTFLCTAAYLYRIDLSTATFGRTNTAPVIIRLRSSPQATSDIVSTTIPGQEIQNERPTAFVFDPLVDSLGKGYYVSIESPGATPGNAVTVYANAPDLYPEGSAYQNGQPVAGDLAFTAYSRQTFTLAGVWRDFWARAIRDVPFLALYASLILAVCGLLAASFCRQAPSHQP